MKKQRWLSLVLILALVVGLCSVCAAAADDQTAEQPAQEAADTVAEAEAAPAAGAGCGGRNGCGRRGSAGGRHAYPRGQPRGRL